MGKPLKIVGIVASIAAILFVALLVLAKIFITPERVRQTVQPLAEKALKRKVELGDIEVSILSGIVLRDLEVKERDGDKTFVAAGQVLLRYQFWPLLFKKVVVDEVRFDNPRIRVVRLADNTFNFSDLISQPVDKEPRPEEQPPSGEGINLLVSEVAVAAGSLEFVDQAVTAGKQYVTTIDSLSITANEISLEKKFPFILEALVNDSPIKLQGDIDPRERTVAASVNIKTLDVVRFSPYFAEKIPAKLDALKLSVDLELAASQKSIASAGDISFDNINLILDALKNAPLKNASLSLTHDLKMDLAGGMLDITSSLLRYNGIPISFKGKISSLFESPRLDGEIDISEFDVAKVLAALPEKLVAAAKPYSPTGTVDALVSLSGPVDQPLELVQHANIKLQAVEAAVGALRPALNGAIVLREKALETENLTVKLGNDTVRMQLAADINSRPIRLTSSISADRLQIDNLLPKTEPTEKQKKEKQETVTQPMPAAEASPLDLPVAATGRVSIKQALYKGLAIDDFILHYKLTNNVMTVEEMTGKSSGGDFDGTATINLARKGYVYSGNLKVKEMQADQIVPAFAPKAKGTVFGTLNLNVDVNGSGTRPETIKKNLSGNGNLLLTDGKLTGAGMAQGLALFLDLEQLRVLQFSKLEGTFTIKNGKVNLNSGVSGSDVRMTPRGTVGLDGALDMSLDTRLAPPLAAKLGSGKVTQFLTDKDGWAQLPIKVTGNASSPSFVLDSSIVQKKIQEKAVDTIQKKIQESLFGKPAPQPQQATPSTPAPQPEPTQQQPQDPAKQLLDEALKGIFKF